MAPGRPWAEEGERHGRGHGRAEGNVPELAVLVLADHVPLTGRGSVSPFSAAHAHPPLPTGFFLRPQGAGYSFKEPEKNLEKTLKPPGKMAKMHLKKTFKKNG